MGSFGLACAPRSETPNDDDDNRYTLYTAQLISISCFACPELLCPTATTKKWALCPEPVKKRTFERHLAHYRSHFGHYLQSACQKISSTSFAATLPYFSTDLLDFSFVVGKRRLISGRERKVYLSVVNDIYRCHWCSVYSDYYCFEINSRTS